MFNSKGGSSIPPLKSGAEWVLSSDGKAELLADTFVKKWDLIPQVGASDFSSIILFFRVDRSFVAIRVRNVKRVLLELDDSTATGPDLLPTRILRMLADALASPVTLLCTIIIKSASWPWRVHWIVPIYKRLSPSQPGNYRGVHLTPALSKVAERVLGKRVRDFFEHGDVWGDSQFAYRKDHSFSDVLALLVALWIRALDRGQKVGMFCADIAGAFDRVSAELLLTKCALYGLDNASVGFLRSYLCAREASVVVGSEFSRRVPLRDTVFQGTVLGPPLWNTFFADVRHRIQQEGFYEVCFADYLNPFCTYDRLPDNADISGSLAFMSGSLPRMGEVKPG